MLYKKRIFKYNFVYFLILILTFILNLFFGYIIFGITKHFEEIKLFSADGLQISLGILSLIFNTTSFISLFKKSEKSIFLLNVNYFIITLFLFFEIYVYLNNGFFFKAIFIIFLNSIIFIGIMFFLINYFKIKSNKNKIYESEEIGTHND
ncbi:hypothetical protein [Chryseobacterium sp. G0201]|uniref:hypothetical protein n=1 Tax=Chryseobacterium sp. G0201 TaxID=2487065 RepID=UPI000F4FC4B5|nr:hypothetical protein [Chryseobacterium sp. G0201]AZA54365.1 hypothetical protein EG348_15880 [Chryseobacterium sp. G0201]